MKDNNDGGAAFPQPIQATEPQYDDAGWPKRSGMSLRDYFAGKAMTALLSQMTYGNQGQHCAMYDPNYREQATTLAHLSYQVADAMLIERQPAALAHADGAQETEL